MITGTITALQVFAQVLMLTDGGPGISTQVLFIVFTRPRSEILILACHQQWH